MAKTKKKSNWWLPKESVPKSEWKCIQGPREYACTQMQAYEEDIIPCSKCADKYWERDGYNYNKQRFKDSKMDSHVDGW